MKRTILSLVVVAGIASSSFAFQSVAGYGTWTVGDQNLGSTATGYAMLHTGPNMLARTVADMDSSIRLFGASQQAVSVSISNSTRNGRPDSASVKVQVGGYTIVSAHNKRNNLLKGTHRQGVLSKGTFLWVGPAPIWVSGTIGAGIATSVAHGIFPWGIQGDSHCGIYEWEGVREFAYGNAGVYSFFPGHRFGITTKMDVLDATFRPWMSAGCSERGGSFKMGALTCERKGLSAELTVSSSTAGTRTLSRWTSEPRYPAILSTYR